MNPSRALLAALRAAETDSLAASQAAAAQAAPPPAPVIVSGVDMSEFLRRLEDMTLEEMRQKIYKGRLFQLSRRR